MRRVLSLLALVCLAFAPAPFPKPERDRSCAHLEAVQGQWVRTFASLGGRRVTTYSLHDVATIGGNRWSEGKAEWTFKLTGRRSSGRIDMESTPASAARGFPSCEGIYKLEGDTLTICTVAVAQGERPSSFEHPKPGVWLEVYKRKRP
jgi:uncharacterized protein (TIGR03067 family)